MSEIILMGHKIRNKKNKFSLVILFMTVVSFQRWQRRFFVLYDDGELAYSVDENVSCIFRDGEQAYSVYEKVNCIFSALWWWGLDFSTDENVSCIFCAVW